MRCIANYQKLDEEPNRYEVPAYLSITDVLHRLSDNLCVCLG